MLPPLHLHGLSSGDFIPALEQFLGPSAELSAVTVTRLTRQRQADHTAFMDRDLPGADHVYVWAGGIHPNVPLEEAKACVLVLIGIRADGSKEPVAIKEGYRESGESWADLMRDRVRQGMRAPVPAIGDGTLGFSWEALAGVLPVTHEQRCWIHRKVNALDPLSKSMQYDVKKAIQGISGDEDRDHVAQAIKTFAQLYGAKFPEAVKKITSRRGRLPVFHDSPAEHRTRLRAMNPIESTFSTVRLRTGVTRGAGFRTGALVMVLEPVESARQRWRAGNAPHLVALVRAGARFERGRLVERPQAVAA